MYIFFDITVIFIVYCNKFIIFVYIVNFALFIKYYIIVYIFNIIIYFSNIRIIILNYQGYYAIIIERKVRFFWILLIYILEVKMINEIAEKSEI